MITYKINITPSNSGDEFGISAFSDNTLIKSVHAITTIKNDIVKLVEICNELEIDICHFDNIIEDYLTDFII